MTFSRGQARTKVQCEMHLFSQGKTPEFTKMGEIHEHFVLALSLVWFAGATPDIKAFSSKKGILFTVKGPRSEGMAGIWGERGFGGQGCTENPRRGVSCISVILRPR